MNKLLPALVLMFGASIYVTGCNKGNEQPKVDKARQDGTEKDKKQKDKEPVDKVLVFAEVASNPKADFQARIEAVELLGQMKSKAKLAVPHLIRAFEDKRPVESGGKSKEERIALTKELWACIARTLAQIGPDAKDAVPALTKKLESWKQPFLPPSPEYPIIAEALWKIEGRTDSLVPILSHVVKRGSFKKEWMAAIRLLGEIGPPAKDAVPSLTFVITDSFIQEEDVRLAAVDAVKKIDPSALPSVVPILRKGIFFPNAKIQSTAIRLLGEIGPPAKEVLPDLGILITSVLTDGGVRVVAAEASRKIDPTAMPNGK